ncbi:MAG: CBS domain-containing protein [Lachnospirales bacterium]
MFVKDIMTKNPIAIPLDYSVTKAHRLMCEKGFSQLPVVDENNTLVGLITEETLEKVSPSSNLNDYEINYLLSKTKLRDIMQTGMYVILEDTIIENAALVIKDNRISSICVIDNDNHLSGIITKTDIFKALITIMNIRESGTRLYLKTNENKNVYKELSDFFSDKNIGILNFCINKYDDYIEISIKLDNSDISDIIDDIKNMGYEIVKINIRS